MIFDVRHKTTFTYEEVVSVSHHVLHLAPRPHSRQMCLESSLTVDPKTSASSEGRDYFGNPVHYLTVQQPHERLIVEARARVDVVAADRPGSRRHRGVGAGAASARRSGGSGRIGRARV